MWLMSLNLSLLLGIPREKNKFVDGLAKNALSVLEPVVVEDAFTAPN